MRTGSTAGRGRQALGSATAAAPVEETGVKAVSLEPGLEGDRMEKLRRRRFIAALALVAAAWLVPGSGWRATRGLRTRGWP